MLNQAPPHIWLGSPEQGKSQPVSDSGHSTSHWPLASPPSVYSVSQ